MAKAPTLPIATALSQALAQSAVIGHRVGKHGAELYRESAARELVKTMETKDAE